MRRILISVFALFLMSVKANSQSIEYTVNDSLSIVNLLSKAGNLPVGSNLPVFLGTQLLGIPYVAKTLDGSDDEHLVLNLREMDCTTFVENVAALTFVAAKKGAGFNEFAEALKNFRYRDGIVDGYTSRLHYFSDWISNNEQKKRVRDVSGDCGTGINVLNIHYMSKHFQLYPQLKNDSALVKEIIEQESRLNGREVSYIPKEKISQSGMNRCIHDGDIIAITTNIDGLDILHVGFAIHQKGQVYLLHASSQAGKVIISAEPLSAYLMNKKSMTGIRVISLATTFSP